MLKMMITTRLCIQLQQTGTYSKMHECLSGSIVIADLFSLHTIE